MTDQPSQPALALLRTPRLSLTVRKKLGKLYGRPKAGQPFAVDLFGTTYASRTGNHMDDKIYLYGRHEVATLRLIRALLRRQRADGVSPVYLDVGANCGQHMLAAAPLADAAHGFEPFAVVRERARANLAHNGLDHAQVHAFGLSDAQARLPFREPQTDNLGTGRVSRAPDAASADTAAVQVRAGDAVMAELGIVPTVIKIDTEGHEEPVLAGLARTIARHRPAIIFEYDRRNRDALGDTETQTRLFGSGYTFFGLRRSREYPRLVPFRRQGRYENVLAYPGDAPPDLGGGWARGCRGVAAGPLAFTGRGGTG